MTPEAYLAQRHGYNSQPIFKVFRDSSYVCKFDKKGVTKPWEYNIKNTDE